MESRRKPRNYRKPVNKEVEMLQGGSDRISPTSRPYGH